MKETNIRKIYFVGPIVFVAIIFVFGFIYRTARSFRTSQPLVATPVAARPAIPQGTERDDGPPEPGGCPNWGSRRLKSTNSGIANVRLVMGLGRVSDRGDYDEITLAESKITADIYTPDVLGYPLVPIRKELELIPYKTRPERKIQGYIAKPMRQIKGPETLVDIVVKNEWEYEISFYRPNSVGPKQDGLYTFVGAPFAVFQFRNPDPPNTNKLEIIRTRDGEVEKSEYAYDETHDTWVLKRNGVEETRKLSMVNPKNPCERIETRFDLEDGKMLKTVKIYKGFPWGQDIVKKIEDPDGKAKSTIYKYFDDINGPHYTFLKTTIHPNGEVEHHNTQPDLTMPRTKPAQQPKWR
jgi:hypothetical protein